MKIETLAAVDIGSNAIRVLISNVEADTPYPDFKKTAFLRIPIRLGEDTFTKGKIGKKKKEQVIHAMKGLSSLMKAYNVTRCRACATSAMRDAENAGELVELIRKKSKIEVEIISGQEEADIIFEAGGLDKVMDRNANYLYVDVGGGSTEVIVFSKQKKIISRSFQLGTVRMLANAIKKDEMSDFKSWLKTIYDEYAPLSIIASGGNINKTHKIVGKKEGEPIIFPELQVLFNILSSMTYEERIRNFKLHSYRADVIIPALEIFLTACSICKVKDIYVPKLGVVDGIIHSLYFKKEG